MNNNYVYMTLLTNNTYVQGVILLNETLKQVNSKYPLVVLVTNDVAQATLDILDYLKIQWKLVDIILETEIINNFKQQQILSTPLNPLWYNTMTKMQVFNQIEYDKIIYLDCDIMILKNIDHLFKESDMIFTKRPDKHLTTGFFIIKPSKQFFNQLINYINNLNPFQENMLFIGGDEEIFELFLLQNNYKFIFLDNKYYNTYIFSYFKYEICKQILNTSYFVHFQGPIKPWDTKELKLFPNYINLNKQQHYLAFPYNQAARIIYKILSIILPSELLLQFKKICYNK